MGEYIPDNDEEVLDILRAYSRRRQERELNEIVSRMADVEERNKEYIETELSNRFNKDIKRDTKKDGKKDKNGGTKKETKGNNGDDNKKLLTYLDLPEDNFIIEYIHTMSQMTSAYPEWHFMMAISMLSVISDRKLCLKLRHKTIYPNVWSVGLGLSTVAQKSTAIKNLGMEVLEKVQIPGIRKRKLPESFSPEGFTEALSECPNGYMWADEAGDLLKSMEKDYMSNMRDLLCNLYECRPYYRRLMKKEIDIEEPFINMVLATTPDNFKSYAKLLDLTSGWLMRYLYLCPEYEKDWMPATQRTNEDEKKIDGLANILTQKAKIVSQINGEISLKLGPGSADVFEKWSEKMYYKVMKNKNNIESAMMGRHEDYVLKLAIIFTFGERVTSFEISEETIAKSCYIIENYFLPMAMKTAALVGTDERRNKMDLVLDTIRGNEGRITRSKLIRKTHIKSKELDEICSTLIEGEEIWCHSESRTKYYGLV